MIAHHGCDAAMASLSELLGDRLSRDELVRQQHGRDASYHPWVAPDAVAFPQSTEEVSAVVRICAPHHRALALDGTCTGEHGIGCGKIEFLLAEHGEAVSVMRAIKRAIDPDNIMNPGKILEV